jgi:uncharacterized protein (UPF0210 family)
MTAARVITTAVKAVPVTQVGYSGLMVPIMEDKLLAQRWAESTYNIDSLLAYSAVCGTGLDTVPLPGDISVEQIERIFEDVASLATKWNKPLSARLQMRSRTLAHFRGQLKRDQGGGMADGAPWTQQQRPSLR